MRIAYLIGRYPAINHGYILREIGELRKLGFEIETASIDNPDRPPEQLSVEEKAEAVRTRYIKSTPLGRTVRDHAAVLLRSPSRYLNGLWYALRLGRGLRGTVYHVFYFAEAVLVGRWMQEKRIERLYAHFSATVASIATRVFPISMSFCVHGFGELHDPVGTNLAGRIRTARMVRAISRHARSLLMLDCNPADWGKLHYVPLGIDPGQYIPQTEPARPEVFSLVSVGRLSPEKGQRLLLEAVQSLTIEGRNIRLHLVGDGPDRQPLEEQARSLGISERVSFEGWIKHADLAAVYARFDVFVMASLYEGIPIVLMEAMAMSMACVAPCITGIPELIRHGEDGLLFAPADVRQLSACVARLMDHSELRQRIGASARQRVLAEYDIARNTEQFAGLLEHWTEP